MIFKKTKLALGIASVTLAMTGALIAPQVSADATAKKVQVLESQVNEMSSMLKQMQVELDRVRSETARPDPQVMELNEWMVSVKSEPVKEETKDNMVFFRGGFAHSDAARNGVSIKSDVVPAGAQEQADKDGWYFGAGFDFSLNNNLFGLMDDTEVLAELMFDYREFGTNVHGNALANNPSQLAGGGFAPRDVTVTMARVSASPKIKFLKGSKFRPWIIPVGFNINIISPPSESITVLQPAMQFALGGDWNFWKNLYLGVDGRYNLSLGDLDGVDTDGFEAGGYLGIGF